MVFLGGLGDNFRRKLGGGRLFVPTAVFQPVADELFVKTRRTPAGLILIRWPETGGVGCHAFVDQDDLTLPDAEFKFGIGDNDAA